ncbi:NAD(P)H-dependent oxidoreductase subunit E [Streptomyces bambusae]|uniref:NAD(P)H-dependent oxidoreductase subunit E n=1 Tax=Streptomyces bambusae TaxID=1550616 RepID=UPI001CFEB683|nr:NAD(P)H-dependent oxidoreductase subunit E [Streptomyces bambusae]MCB5163848.1 NAD(P)H-dependent oxidoreductase subunit E [Streptomyces bambusae]
MDERQGSDGARFDALRALAARRGRPGDRLLDDLARARLGNPSDGTQWSRPVADRLGLPAASALGPATFYADLAAPHGRRHVRACTGAACFAATGGRPLDAVERQLGVRVGEVSPDGAVSVQAVRCLGHCYAAPAALDGDTACTGPTLTGQFAGRVPPAAPPIPGADTTGDPVLLGSGPETEDPWEVWRRTVTASSPAEVHTQVDASGLRGRGGAGYRVASKWRAVPRSAAPVVVANGDEGDPGSYADRLLMEQHPQRVLAGLALACFACGAASGRVLVRSEYPAALSALRSACEEAYLQGHFGSDVHGTGRALDIVVCAGHGSYVAGEETALIASLEGGRGCARPRPPYPTEQGLWNAPTVVGNVETLAALPWIVSRGGAAYARRGTPSEPGTKLVSLSERFARPGVYEVELGTRVEHIVSGLGGGLKDGARPAVVQIGGPLGGFLPGDRLDVALTDADLSGRGAALGHGGLVAFDDSLDPADVLCHIWQFAAAESCGACSPCRVGTRAGLELAAAGGDPGEDWTRLAHVLEEASLCAFGKRLPAAVRSLARAYGPRFPEGWLS